MKSPIRFLFLGVCLVLNSCAGGPPTSVTTANVPVEPVSVAGNTIPEDSQDRLRTPEVIKAYPNGRYIDPNDPSIMHEAGITYRKEQDPQWNLDPNNPGYTPVGPLPPVTDPNKTPSPLTAELQNELQNQKKYSASIIEQNEAMTKRLEELDQLSSQLKAMLDQNQDLKSKNQDYQTQIEDLKKKIDLLTAKPAPEPSLWEKTKNFFSNTMTKKKPTDQTSPSTQP